MTYRTDHTRAVYDEVATEYASRIADELKGKPLDCALLDVFATSLGDGARICDAGCGPGHVARYLHDRGANVYGLDLSTAMVSEAIRRNPDIEFRIGDITDLAGEPTDLAGIVAFYSLIHLPREAVTAVLGNMRRHLRPNGRLFIAFHIGSDELHIDEWWGRSVSLDFTFFEVAEMRGYVEQAGFAIEWVVEREAYAGVEHPSRRAYVLARKPDLAVGLAEPPS